MAAMANARALLVVCVLCGSGFSQDGWVAPSTSDQNGSAQTESLADRARRVRKAPNAEVKMTETDEKELFRSVDEIFDFAAGDTGFPKKTAVKRRLVSSADVEKFVRERMANDANAKQFAQSEMSMKKFGFLPRDFDLRGFLVKASGQQIAGYYDENAKSISLLNWIPLEQQKPILAHELTHALQDQNFNLKAWQQGAAPGGKGGLGNIQASEKAHDESVGARHAVVEGQAMVVYVDYLLAPLGSNLKTTPGLIYQMEEPAVKAVADSEMMHNAPAILRESGAFPYRDGLIFVGELLAKGGQQMAFAGLFARPPRTSHEVLQPKSYIEDEKLAPVHIPDMRAVLSDKYEAYDAGDIGELDLRALLKTYGERKSADELAALWQGGSYATFRKAGKDASQDSSTTADIALLYVSHWKTPQAAERFAHIYSTAVGQRYHTASAQQIELCAGEKCPASSSQIMTEEGPVIVEQWDDNSVVISESFDVKNAAKLRDKVRESDNATVQAENVRSTELSSRLYEMPGFRAFQQRIGDAIAREMAIHTGR